LWLKVRKIDFGRFYRKKLKNGDVAKSFNLDCMNEKKQIEKMRSNFKKENRIYNEEDIVRRINL